MSDIDTTLLRALLNAVNEIRDRLGEAEHTPSSVELKTSARGVDLAVKCYVDSAVESAGSAALAEYGRLMREIRRQQENDWADTLAQVARR